ncbi:penicillin-binding transpeptidase domain-containing protein [Solicola gregarius]|uniref:Beta-lactamase n=1 Tax=Solicola gregarius TaxID=2908642 RepID=A0AA46TFI2_9ACTN|nr:penicillin-binding transpeptidase domain-containing protein [Solicola gregarius]UYM04389.1 penicillin-binding protein [Solicola gregarius]
MLRSDSRVRALAVACALLACVGGLAACSDDSDESDPKPAAEGLATAVSDGDVGSLTFSGTSGDDAQADFKNVMSGMGDYTPDVSVGDVSEDGDTATAILDVSWALGESGSDAQWSYETEATLQRDGDKWQPEWDRALIAPDLKQGEHLSLTGDTADRGEILDRNRQPIVKERPVVRMGLDKLHMDKPQVPGSARQLAQLLDIDVAGYVAEAKAAGPDAFVEAIVLRKVDARDVDAGAYERIKGAVQIADTMSLAPTSDFAEPILGSVGEATAELIKDSDGELAPGDITGLSGLQQRYDEQLRGQQGLLVEAVSKSGKDRKLYATKPTAGKPLKTTLDVNAQADAEDALSDVSSPSALVAIQPSSGDILAAASGPGSEGYSTATVGQYAPGSTFKVVTSLAMLRNGYSPDDTLTCSPTVDVNGKSFKNYDDYPSSALGQIPMRTAIAQSCNTALIGEQADVPQDALADAAASLGLGEDHDTGFSSYFGSVPSDAPTTEHAASMIGQGKVQASPMAMAVVAASVESGETVVPSLVTSHQAEKAAPDVPLDKGEAKQLRELMLGVVRDGSGSFLADLPGKPIGAKTGTAEYGDATHTHAWMIAFQGDLAVAVFVEDGESGSGTAGPILEQFLRQR